MSSDSDDGIFITQSSFSISNVIVNSDFEKMINESSDENFNQNFNLDSNEFSDSDSVLIEESQKVEKELNSKTISEQRDFVIEETNSRDEDSRFGEPLSPAELQKLCNSAYSVNTENKSLWAYRLYKAWVEERSKRKSVCNFELNLDILTLARDEAKLNKTLVSFIVEVRNQKGEEYRGNTLYEIVSSLQYYIRRNGIPINVFESPYFAELRNTLDARMKFLAQQGIGIDKRQACVISVSQEDQLWEKRLLGEDTPQQVIDTLVYLIGLNCALRAGDEHRNLRVGPNSQFQLIDTQHGNKQLQYTEDVSKTNRGGLKHRKLDRKTITIHPNEERPERCLVRLYQKYMSLRPKNGKCTAFYLRPMRYVSADRWFSDCAIGTHPLRGTIGRLCKQASFPGFFSNHSLRATTATRLYDSGIDEQLIAERTGHKSVAIRGYKRTSAEMEATVDAIIQRKAPSASTFAASTSTSSTASTLTKEQLAPADPRDLKLVLKDGVTLSLKF